MPRKEFATKEAADAERTLLYSLPSAHKSALGACGFWYLLKPTAGDDAELQADGTWRVRP